MYELTSEERDKWLTRIELDITEQCNMSCPACSRCCDKFKSDKHLDVSVVRQFVDDSIDLDYGWKSIKIIGGEPTLHPKLDVIITILHDYKKMYPGCDISILSNGVIKHEYPEWLTVNYTLDHSHHRPFYISPADEDKLGSNKLCNTLWQCGIGLGSYGYTPCVLGTAMCRVWGHTGISRLYNCTEINLLAQCRNLCTHCGAYLTNSHSFFKGDIFNYEVTQMTVSWEKKLEEYQLFHGQIH